MNEKILKFREREQQEKAEQDNGQYKMQRSDPIGCILYSVKHCQAT